MRIVLRADRAVIADKLDYEIIVNGEWACTYLGFDFDIVEVSALTMCEDGSVVEIKCAQRGETEFRVVFRDDGVTRLYWPFSEPITGL